MFVKSSKYKGEMDFLQLFHRKLFMFSELSLALNKEGCD